jgi:hypothetical protein
MSMLTVARIVAAFATAIPALVFSGTSAPTSEAQANCRVFPETGKQVCGRFLQYWDAHGGLAQQGLPLSGEFQERSDVDGKLYTVQYFERAVFEMHPENAAPYDVLLSLLGRSAFKTKYPNGAPELPPPMNPVAGRLFPETGKEIRGAFLAYWNSHGGLAQQGFPISNPLNEKSDLDGKLYTVQYFERAVFELHPENAGTSSEVLLSQLGTARYKSKYPNGAPGGGGGATGPTPTPGAGGADSWSDLSARPIKIPAIDPAGACPISPSKTVSATYGPALGDGPAYPVGFGSDGKFDLAGALRDAGGFYVKVLWVVDPAYKKPVLVRGRQINGTATVLFGEGTQPGTELRLDTSTTGGSGWQEFRTYTRVRSAGCFAYQVDTPDASKVIYFRTIQTMP